MSRHILLLAGSGEARELADVLKDDPRYQVTASLAGATRAPLPLGVETISGGFGGSDGFRKFLTDNEIAAVIDATHPFANQMTGRSSRVAEEAGLPYLQVLRPGWTETAMDEWHFVEELEQAAEVIPEGSTVFLGTGRKTLGCFENLSSCRLICRQIDPPDGPFPFPNGRFEIGRPPFSVEDELAFFRNEKIDWLVVKNSGGANSFSKLEAARHLGLPVVLQRRTKAPVGDKAETVPEALAWLENLF